MKKIERMFNPMYTDNGLFIEKVMKDIDILEKLGLEVEVQYAFSCLHNGTPVYSALILGRKEDK